MSPEALEQLRRQYLGAVSSPQQPMVTGGMMPPPGPLVTDQPQAVPIPQVQPIPPMNMLPPTQEVVPTQQSNISQIQPYPALPAQQRLEHMTAPNIEDPAFRNSRLRTVLNAIAGGLAGAAGGPKAGIEVGSALHNMKYNRAMQQYANELELATKQAGSEAGRVKTGETAALLPSKVAASEATTASKLSGITTSQEKVQIASDLAKSKIERQKVLDEHTKWQEQHPHQTDLQYIMSLPEDKRSKVMEVLKEEHDAKQRTDEEAAARAGKIRASQLAEESKYGPGITERKAAAQVKGKDIGEEAVEKTDRNQAIINDHVAQLERNPTEYYRQLGSVPAKYRSAVQAKFLANHNNIPNWVNPTQKTAVSNSGVALLHADNIQRLFDDPAIRNNWGPIKGRLAKLASAWGGESWASDPWKDVPDRRVALDQIMNDGSKLGMTGKEQELLGYLAYLVTYEASSASGTRPSWQLINFLKTQASPSASMERDRFQGALNVVKGSAQARIKEAYEPKDEHGMLKPMVAPSDQTKPKFKINWEDANVVPEVKKPGDK